MVQSYGLIILHVHLCRLHVLYITVYTECVLFAPSLSCITVYTLVCPVLMGQMAVAFEEKEEAACWMKDGKVFVGRRKVHRTDGRRS